MSAAEIISSANDLLAAHTALINRARLTQKTHRRQLRTLNSPPQELLKVPLIPSPEPSPPPSRTPSPSPQLKQKPHRSDLPPAKRARLARYDNYVPEEETIRNDYSQRYVDGGEWPQNWVLGADPDHRFEEYPKQQRLLALKKASVASHALTPTYLPYSELNTLHPSKFDVILIDPPFSSSFTWDDLQELPVPALAADPSFVFMWVGSGAGEGLERGREIMAKWGFRRCEDIVWVKTNNTTNHGPGTDPPTTSLLTRTKQHCLMGIRGTVRRSTDSWFVHCNVDTDVLIWEGDPVDPTLKPPEMYTLIENFCLGLRRLEIFGRAKSLRRGWVVALAEGEESVVQDTADDQDASMGEDEDEKPIMWHREAWEAKMKEQAAIAGGRCVVPMTSEIDALRPKSPVRGGTSNAPTSGAVPLSTGAGNSGIPFIPGNPGGGGGRGGFNAHNQGPRMMGPPIMLGGNSGPGINQLGGMGGDMGMGMQSMGWQDPGMGGPMNVMGGGMGMPGNLVNLPGNLGNLPNLGNLANLGNMNNMGQHHHHMGGAHRHMPGMVVGGPMGMMGPMGGMGQFGGPGGGAFDGMGGGGGWEGQGMMGMGGMGMGGMNMGMGNAMGMSGVNMGMNGGMPMGMNNGGMGMGGGNNMGGMGMGGMGMGQWGGR